MAVMSLKNSFVKASILLAALLFLPLLSQTAYAVFDLSVSPFQGGFDLRFDKITPDMDRVNREVNVRITTDINKQYRLTNTFLQPLSTPEGVQLPMNSFVVYAIRGTNSFGTMNVLEQVPLRMGDQLIYTSNQTGNADAFTLVYSILPSPSITAGTYHGRLGFTITPIDSSSAPVTRILEVTAEIEVESAIEIKTATGSKVISLDPSGADTQAAAIGINIKGGFGKQFRILQLINEQPVSSEGELLGWQAVTFKGVNAQRGTAVSQDTPLSNGPQVIYTSAPGGDADNFILEYRLADLTNEKAGKFRTSVKYVLEGIGFAQSKLIDTLALEIENPRVFDITIYPQNQKGVIEFLNLTPTAPAQTNVMDIEVKSNTGKQYQVTQNMLSDLVSKDGEAIRAQYFTLRTEAIDDTKGMLKFPAAGQVNKGYTVLFVSDKKGSPDKFRVVYTLAPSRDIKSGDYSTKITYSLSEL